MEIELIEIQNLTLPHVSPCVDGGKVWEGGLVNRENKNQDAGRQRSWHDFLKDSRIEFMK